MSKKTEPIHLEKTITKLNEIVARLESGDLTLEQSLSLYEEGISLSDKCKDYLLKAEQKITKLSSKSSIEEGV